MCPGRTNWVMSYHPSFGFRIMALDEGFDHCGAILLFILLAFYPFGLTVLGWGWIGMFAFCGGADYLLFSYLFSSGFHTHYLYKVCDV